MYYPLPFPVAVMSLKFLHAPTSLNLELFQKIFWFSILFVSTAKVEWSMKFGNYSRFHQPVQCICTQKLFPAFFYDFHSLFQFHASSCRFLSEGNRGNRAVMSLLSLLALLVAHPVPVEAPSLPERIYYHIPRLTS